MTNKKEEEAKKDSKKENESVKNNKKSSRKEEKLILFDLVEASEIDLISIIMDLSHNNLLDQYYDEAEMRSKGIPIIPSITKKEFEKIIGE